ncbi:MAG: three-Cys-motif partner protein TcmP [Emcibacter sp.]|nr:three-Cys-motif partner protein TcmP [Emcibacter sp.]
MAQKRFGSVATTGKKFDVIGEYLSMYQRALGNTSLQTVYIDGFAGSGEIPLVELNNNLFDEEVKTVIAGSADRALNVDKPFDHYVFIDKRKKCVEALQKRFQGNPNANRVNYVIGDANEHIQNICRYGNWCFKRGVVLLDPFGSQVDWETIKAIAKTKALDLWYLFPAGLSVFRQIGKDGRVDPTHESSITRLLGTDEWKTAFLKPSKQRDLFDAPVGNEKVVTPESAALYYD